jgi:hypothetical protein
MKDAAIEDHQTSKQRRVDGDEHVRSVGKQAQLFECDFGHFDHRDSPGHLGV